jgi:hypothetical protein
VVFEDQFREYFEAFARLEALAQQGMVLCEELENLTAPPISRFERIQEIAAQLQVTDRDLNTLGATLPAVNHFVLDFAFGKQNLEGREVKQLAQRTKQLYARLAEGTRRFLQLWKAFGETLPVLFAKPECAPGFHHDEHQSLRSEAV